MEYAATTGAAGTEKFNPNAPPTEPAAPPAPLGQNSIAHDLHFLIANPDPVLLGPDPHREPVAGPA